jgi:hypothetical protein
MTRVPNSALFRASGFATVLAVLAFGSTSASAHEAASVDTTPRAVAQGDTTQLSLNLLSEPRRGTRTVRTRSIGSGSYLCSLAGLGQRSRCRRN